MADRKYLKPRDEIILSRTKSDKGTKFEVLDIVGSGGSTICYKVSCSDEAGLLGGGIAKRGNLKEFHPEWISTAQRTRHNQLCFYEEEERKRYKTAAQDFLSAYQTLERVKIENIHNEVLNNYIPAYELYFGYESDEHFPTVYVWTPDDQMGVGFDQYLTSVRGNPQEYPVHKMYNILNTMITLTDGVSALHRAGLLHLDIKPSNFLVSYNSQYEINPGNISLFDINTFYSVYSDIPSISGTVGYRAPEVEQGRADNRSDIYSLGAVLFYAVIISDEIERNGFYKDEYYSKIDQLVFASEIFKVSSVNDNTFLKSKIAKILKRCLAKKPSQRYECCEELINDLKDTQIHLITAKENHGEGQKRFELIEKGHQGKTSPVAIMQNLLFNQPLLKWVPKGSSKINVLVVGAGTYAQKFMDICLQLGQIAGFHLYIDVVSDEIDYDRNVYLQFRPALNEFVNINDSLRNSSKESYADINFGVESWNAHQRKDTEFSRYNQELNQRNAGKLMSKNPREGYQYIFIALGEDSLNRYVADAFVSISNELMHNCLINYIVESSANEAYNGGANPVNINALIKPGTIHKDLERMAFNTHLMWKKPEKIEQEIVQEFYDTYNYESSLSFALSIRYKLLSLEITDEDFMKAAEKFADLMKKDERIYSQMVAYEHRRWVIHEIAQGWSAPKNDMVHMNFDKWVEEGNYRAKGRNDRFHLCIVQNSEKMPSLDEIWDNEISEIESNGILDDLDKVSIKLHQALKKYAKKLKDENPEHNQTVKGREEIEVIERNMYCNYKSYNEELVKEIPLILTKGLPTNINLHESIILKSNEELETYTPEPIDTKDVVLPEELDTLTEKLSEHVHDIWALGRIKEGWRNGFQKDGELLINPCLVPYSELPDDEKQYDRDTALETLKLIVKMGYKIEKK